MEIIHGKIINITPEGLFIKAPYQNIERACIRRYSTVEIGLNDGRFISTEQRKKAYALMREISEYTGETAELTKQQLKLDFVVNRMQALSKQIFSLSDCDMTTAREFITYLIDFILEYDIPTRQPLISLCEDIEKYIYACLIHKKCCVCGQTAELHHVERIGAGRNRDKIYQIGMLVLPLCRKCHVACHSQPQEDFNKLHHLKPIPLTKEIAKVYGLTKRNMEERR